MVPGDDLQILSFVQGMPVLHTIYSYIDFHLLYYDTYHNHILAQLGN